MSATDRELWREQDATPFAGGNLDMEALAGASSLPTVLQLLSIPSVAASACQVIVGIVRDADAEAASWLERRAGQIVGKLAGLLQTAAGGTQPVVIVSVASTAAHLAEHSRCRAWIWQKDLIGSLVAAGATGRAARGGEGAGGTNAWGLGMSSWGWSLRRTHAPLAVFCLCLFLLFTGLPEGALTGTREGVGALPGDPG